MSDRDTAIDDLLALLRLERQGASQVALAPDTYGPVVFGGIGLALTISAAGADAPEGTRLHSLHTHFLRPMCGGQQVTFDTEVLKAGRTFTLLSVMASQAGRPVLRATCSFTTDGDGESYDLSGIPAGVSMPDELPEVPGWGETPDDGDEEVGPWEGRWLGPSEPRSDGTREATHRHWFRIPRQLPDDPHLHTALLGYATDWTGLGGRPLNLEGDTTGMVSLDHAAWFHRTVRADQWLLQDVQSLVNAGGRSMLRGVIRSIDGQIVASMSQEMLLL